MTRAALLLLLLLPAACGGGNTSSQGEGIARDNVARAALAGGSPEIALNVSNAILVRTPRDFPALLSKGDALGLLGRYNEAAASYQLALEVDSHSIDAQIGLGRLSLRSDSPRAQALFLSVLQSDPSNKVALNDLGIVYDLQGDHVKAQDAYRRALGSDPAMHAAEVNLALSMALNGRAADAVRMLRPMAGTPGAPIRLRHDLAVALARSGDKEGAAKVLGADMTPEQIKNTLIAYGEFSQ